jgi:hypothetical protein
MSGCYRCGLPDGSDSRLCETCFNHRFNHGEPVAPCQSDLPADGIEFTSTTKRWLLSGGVAFYVAVVGLGLLVQAARIEVRRNAYQPDLLRYGANEFPVEHETEVAFLAGPLGDGLQ